MQPENRHRGDDGSDSVPEGDRISTTNRPGGAWLQEQWASGPYPGSLRIAIDGKRASSHADYGMIASLHRR
jgi:hypothetical protein